jgi:hypothetical protein
MEMELDNIALGKVENWYEVCDKCNEEITNLIKPTKNIVKQVFDVKDSDEYKIVYEMYGAVLRKILDTGKYEYKSIRKDIILDLDVLRSGGYSLEDLIYTPVDAIKDDGTTTVTTPLPSEIENKKILRVLNENLSIRLGKFGAYIYYKTPEMTKPNFYNINKFKQSYKFSSEEVLLKWIKDTYDVC